MLANTYLHCCVCLQVQLCSLLLHLANGEVAAYDKALDRVVAAACSSGGGASANPRGRRRRASQLRSADAAAAAMAATAAADVILPTAGSGSTVEPVGASGAATSVTACEAQISQAAGSVEEASSPPAPPPPRRSPGGRAAALRRLIDGWCRTTVGCAAEQQQQQVDSAAAAPAAAFSTLRPLLEAVWQLGEPAPLIDTKRSGSATELQVGPNAQQGYGNCGTQGRLCRVKAAPCSVSRHNNICNASGPLLSCPGPSGLCLSPVTVCLASRPCSILSPHVLQALALRYATLGPQATYWTPQRRIPYAVPPYTLIGFLAMS